MGVLQGLTEFFPVSSTAHVDIYPRLLNLTSPVLNSLTFDVALHAGTLVALVIYFWKRILELLGAFFKGLAGAKARETKDFKLSVYIIAATIPAALAGALFEKHAGESLRAIAVVASMLIIFAVILYIADRFGSKRKEIGSMNIKDAIIIGFAQALAIIPGVSRSGISITAGLITGYMREDAAEFSFLLCIPIILGAVLMKSRSILHDAHSGSAMIIALGFTAALISGFLAIKWLLGFVKKNSYNVFVGYRIALGVVLLIFFMNR
jgi:undecaprenyl-diphosphatase